MATLGGGLNVYSWKKPRLTGIFLLSCRVLTFLKESVSLRPVIIASCFLFVTLWSYPGKAQTASPAQSTTASTQAPSAQSGPTTQYTLPPDKLAKAKALYDISGRLRVIGTIWGFVVLIGILYVGVVARFRNWAERAATNSFLQALIVIPLFIIILNVLDWPLAAYGHRISLQYGLSVQHWGSWFGDLLKGLAISIVISTFALWGMIRVIRWSPKRWWFYFWLIALPFIVFFTIITPIVIDPMFNKFEPLDKTNPQLVDAIEKVVHRAGMTIPRDRMFLMKASEKTTTLNAYVTGFGPSKRVVVWDTTIQKATTPETLFVFGHEMGHYVLNHVVIGICAGAVGLLIGLFLLYLLSGWFLRRWGARWQIRELGDWAALPMIFLIFSILGFFATPIESSVSRVLEHNADVYGLEVTHGINANPQEAAAHAFQTLGELSLDYPNPSKLVVFWYYSHPTIADRVRFAHNYDPWAKGEQPRYVK
ncbi:MAG TPA: M48 family metallopeptidase [Candidatus Acidoferrales bacterium]|jgi:STE24 endopeptidase|nr:M48 family metallopeptidase [Candidatus Acidoferrales bacterium]